MGNKQATTAVAATEDSNVMEIRRSARLCNDNKKSNNNEEGECKDEVIYNNNATNHMKRWSVNDSLAVERDYDLLKLTIPAIAEKHGRTPKSIIFKLLNDDVISTADALNLGDKYGVTIENKNENENEK